ncbi:TGS domain-containing protein [candidate division KSB1 bacterium]|nr:TGS domain-containing protein [candidate division KSB1 bacterium]
MPANLSPEYYRAEEEYRKAATPHQRLDALKKMLSAIPKHKGTEKMQADLKKRIAAQREEIQHSGRKKGFSYRVEKEGGGQVVLAGGPNSGKSQLAAGLSCTPVEVAPYPYSTRMPHPVMMTYEDIQIQLVDVPPVCSEHMEYWVPTIIRSADLVVLVADLSADDVLEKLEDCIQVLTDAKIDLVAYKPKEDFWASVAKKCTRLVGTKLDVAGARDNWEVVRELYVKKFSMSAVSAQTGEAIDRLREEIFLTLNIIRVYSKPPGKDADMHQPFVLGRGSTVFDFANTVHRDFAERLKFARLWGHGKFEGQRVNRDYVLKDKDVVELHL